MADLLRTGAGLNPMVREAFYAPSAELGERLSLLREERLYTCPIETSPAFHAGLLARAREHELWSFAVMLETLSPSFNVPLRVPTALSPDLTMLVPTERILTPEEGSCAALPSLLPRLREAAVTRVLSLDPLEHEDLAPVFALSPARTRPLTLYCYALRDALPRAALEGAGRIRDLRAEANRIELVVEADAPTTLVVRDAWAPGWTASVDGEARDVQRLGRHRSVALPAGTRRVQLEYRPAGARRRVRRERPGARRAGAAGAPLLARRAGQGLAAVAALTRLEATLALHSQWGRAGARRLRPRCFRCGRMRNTRGPQANTWPSSQSSPRATPPHAFRGSLSRKSRARR